MCFKVQRELPEPIRLSSPIIVSKGMKLEFKEKSLFLCSRMLDFEYARCRLYSNGKLYYIQRKLPKVKLEVDECGYISAGYHSYLDRRDNGLKFNEICEKLAKYGMVLMNVNFVIPEGAYLYLNIYYKHVVSEIIKPVSVPFYPGIDVKIGSFMRTLLEELLKKEDKHD